MVTSSQQDRELPFLPTLLCLWGAGWVTSLVTSFLFLGRVYSSSTPSTVMVAANLLLSAAIGAVVVQYLLLSVVDCNIPYSATLLALVAGSVASTVARLILASSLQGGASQPVLPIAGLGASFLPALIGAVVSWWLLQNAAGSRSPVATVEPPGAAVSEPPVSRQIRVFDDPHAGDPTASGYSELVSAVRESALGLVGTVNSVPPDSVASAIADGLVPYEVATKRLEQAQLPSTVSPDLHQRLIAGLKQLEEDLTLTAEEAATTAGTRLYQRGLLSGSMADVSDGGGRYRWELEQSEGLRTVKQALRELRELGFAIL
ncbi:MAG TPA: hypothetical protein VMG74_07935 [Gaiellaceae bacterium]|nr:hypothetical protein [Gaiellaceae bacterium]